MSKVSSYEAKTHLPRLLERVRHGERFTITRHGVPIAELVPFGARHGESVDALIGEMRELRRGLRLGKLRLEDLIAEGRK